MDKAQALRILEGLEAGDVAAARAVFYGPDGQEVASAAAALPPVCYPYTQPPAIVVPTDYTIDPGIFVGSVTQFAIHINYDGYCQWLVEENAAIYKARADAYRNWRYDFTEGQGNAPAPVEPFAYRTPISYSAFAQWWLRNSGAATPNFQLAPVVIAWSQLTSTFDFAAAQAAKQKILSGAAGQPGSIAAYNPTTGGKN